MNFRRAIAALLFAALPMSPLLARPAASRELLPADVVPTHYDIQITPHPALMAFTGSVRIDIDVRRATRRIVLNASDLAFDKVAIDGSGNVLSVAFDTTQQTATLTFPAPISPGSHVLSIDYAGRIYQEAEALFALDYDSSSGSKRALFTQFENAQARRFIPSWDEPERKATFTLTAVVPAEQMAVSNTPIGSSEPVSGGLKRVRFATSPKMSTYLLFLAVGDFERISKEVDGIDVGVVVKRGDTQRARFALDAAAHLLPYYDDYFGVKYPLPKLDLIAGPGESQSFSAMENWGAIFFFENSLLIDPKISTQADRRSTYTSVAHEMSHQWFGDLVTMSWWNDLWLNEGFAEWMQDKASDHFHPEWRLNMDSENSKEVAIRADAEPGTHPVVRPIRSVVEASESFDDITYQKGEAVLRMLESYVGEEAFRASIRNYIRSHEYANTVTDDLWHELDKTAAPGISDIAHDFTLKAGVPLIRVTRTAGGYHLAEDCFTAEGGNSAKTDWHVPVLARPLDSHSPWHGLITREHPADIAAPSDEGVIVNVGQNGYFRTFYDHAALAPLIRHFHQLSPVDEVGVLNDSRALGYSGYEPLSDFLELAREVTPATDVLVSNTLAGRLQGIDSLYTGLPGQARYRAYARRILKPLLAGIGTEGATGEDPNVKLLREMLFSALSQLDDPEVVDEANARFAAYMQVPSTLTGDRRSNVLNIVAEHADAATWEQLHSLAKNATSTLDKSQLYELLGTVNNRDLAVRALNLALSDEVAITTRPSIIDNVSIHFPELAFDFSVAHLDRIMAWVEPDSRYNFIPDLVEFSWDPSTGAKLRQYAAAHIPVDERQEAVKVEGEIEYFFNVRRKRLPEVDRWLSAEEG